MAGSSLLGAVIKPYGRENVAMGLMNVSFWRDEVILMCRWIGHGWIGVMFRSWYVGSYLD